MVTGLNGRRAVVIGAAGFIGRHLIARLVRDGIDVVAFVRSSSDTRELQSLGVRIEFGDACSADDLTRVIEANDLCFLLAGGSGAAVSVTAPRENYAANCGAMLALLDVASHLEPRPRIVFTGSRLQYGRVKTLPVDESHPQEPTSPYGLHKSFCESYLELYRRRFDISYAVARLTNPFGASLVDLCTTYNVFDQIIRRAIAGETITVYGDGSQMRDYIHIDDVVSALCILGTREDDIVVNIGSGEGIMFRDAVERVVARAGGDISFVPWPTDALDVETGDFVASIQRARGLGFAPRISFDAGIDRSIAGARATMPPA